MICLWAAILSGCSMAPDDNRQVSQTVRVVVPTAQQNSVHYYTQRLANQLFRSVLAFKPNAGIAIGTFTQVDTLTLNENPNHPLRLLGLQLEEGLMTASIGQGLKVIEYKTRDKLTIKADQDLMLSRDVKALSASQDVQYFLTGTLTEQESGVVVNARLIDTANNQVIAAATDYVPINTLWGANKVKLKQNLIYRTAY
jgi:TolB-like protein